MTSEEKAAVMQFMGQTYGEIHKQDQNIVGGAGNLQPSSHVMKEVFEKTAHIPTVVTQQQQQQQQWQQQQQQQQQQQEQQQQQQVQPVPPEQAARELAQTQAPEQPQLVPIYDDIDPDQMELDLSEPSKVDQLISLVKKQTLLLEEIKLKLDNGKKTTRGRKQG